MYCNGCGQALVAGQGFCPRCGRASGMGMPMAPVSAPRIWLPLGLIERRVNALAMGWLIYGGLIAIGGFCGLAFAHAFLAGHGGPFGSDMHPWGEHGHRFWMGPGMPLFFMRFAWMALAVRAGLALAAGFGLMHDDLGTRRSDCGGVSDAAAYAIRNGAGDLDAGGAAECSQCGRV